MNVLSSLLINNIIVLTRDINTKLLKKTRNVFDLIIKEIMFL